MEPGKIKIGDEVFFVVYDSEEPDDPIAMLVRMKVDRIVYQGTTHEIIGGETYDAAIGDTRGWGIPVFNCWSDKVTALSQARTSLQAEKAKLEKKARSLGFRLL